MTLKATFAVWNLSDWYSSGNVVYYYLRYVYTWIRKHTWLVILTVFSQTKDFSRSHAVTYTLNIVVSRKRCKMESFILQITKRSDYSPSNSGNSDDLEWPSRSVTYYKPFQNVIFLYSCAAVEKISSDVMRRAVPLQQLSFLFKFWGSSNIIGMHG